jgi:hypothetical protein
MKIEFDNKIRNKKITDWKDRRYGFLANPQKNKNRECSLTLVHLPAFPSYNPDIREQAKESTCQPSLLNKFFILNHMKILKKL